MREKKLHAVYVNANLMIVSITTGYRILFVKIELLFVLQQLLTFRVYVKSVLIKVEFAFFNRSYSLLK